MFFYWGADQFMRIFINGYTLMCSFDKEEEEELRDQQNPDLDLGVFPMNENEGIDHPELTPRFENNSN
jgi:hypothetical protein